MKSKVSARKNKQVQVRDLIEPAKPDWYREDIHGPSALAARQRARQEDHLNRPKRGSRCGFKDWQRWREKV